MVGEAPTGRRWSPAHADEAGRTGRDGDEVAFTELVDLDGDRCYAIAYRILRDVERAQDAVQQAFLLAWRELPRLRDPERFSPGSTGCS